MMDRVTSTVSIVGMIFFLVGTTFAISSNSAYACSCLLKLPRQTHIERADAIFAGTAVRVNEKAGTIVFDVSKVWKGYLEKRTIIHGAGDSASCGWNPLVGKDYLIYAHADSESSYEYTTTLCDPNVLLEDAGPDLALLKEGANPLPISSQGGDIEIFIMFLLAGIFFAGCIITIAKLRRL